MANNKVTARPYIKGNSSKLASRTANNSYGGDFKKHPWYDGSKNTPQGGLHAHHLITTKSLNGLSWEKWRGAYEYDINNDKNGIMLPSCVKIACQVKTHVHLSHHSRGLNYDDITHRYLNNSQPSPIPDDISESLYEQDITYLEGVKILTRAIQKRAKNKFYCQKGNKKYFTMHLDDVS